MMATAMPMTRICHSSPLNWSFVQRKLHPRAGRALLRRHGRHGTRILPFEGLLGRRVSNVAPNPKVCNICFMAQPARSPLNELCSALPSLPTRLQQVGRFVAANDYDATTRSMRELASVAGADPASFTRLAKAIGYSGWDELRAALTEARRPSQASPFSGRARGRRQGPNADVSLISDKLEADAAGLSRISAHSVARGGPRAACRATDLDRRLSQLPQRRGTAQLPASAVPPRRGATRRRLRPRGSRSRRVPLGRSGRRDRLRALFDRERRCRREPRMPRAPT